VSSDNEKKSKVDPKALKGFKHSKPGLFVSLGGSAFGAFGIVKDVRRARAESDTLRLVNAVVSAAALVTGALLVIREIRQLGNDDVLSG